MDVLMKIGLYAGQIRDIEPIYARQLIAAGSATDPYALPDETKPEKFETITPKPETKKRK